MRTIPVFCVTAICLSACQAIPEYPARVTAQLQSATGGGIFGTGGAFGTAVFEPAGNNVHVIVYAEGLTPGQQYGLRIQNAGDCSGQGTSEPRALRSLRADNMGRATVETDVDGATVAAGPGSIVGRSLVIHGGPDAGAGAPVACGAIRAG